MNNMAEDNPGLLPDRQRKDVAQLRRYSSEQLFAGNSEIEIQHASDIYRIRITRNGKLIMNK